MKLTSSSSTSPAPGVALVIVLSMLVLLSALLVAFMTTANTERSASYANAGVTSARQLADSTVSLVISQIRDATTVPDEDTTWSSQPGAIRTFSGTLSGTKKTIVEGAIGAYYDGYTPGSNDTVYKLYSADRLKVSASDYAGAELASETSVIDAWKPLDAGANANTYPDYVDLNQPILSPRRDLDANGGVVEPHYPIIDPRAKLDVNNADTPGADPGIVEGFDGKIGRDATLKMPKPTATGVSAAVPYLPMPVKWLYVLRDGTIGPASLGTDINPIVGRTAFWTDDETCKLNINTAGEGTYWESPTASSQQECGNISGQSPALINEPYTLALAASQPAHGEFQRYPGHPATTCLSPVFGQLFPTTQQVLPMNATTNKGTWTYPWLSNGPNAPYRDFKNALYQMLPYSPNYDTSIKGTSYSATMNTDQTVDTFGNLSVKTKHLFNSVDDMLFKPNKVTGVAADQNTPLTQEALEKTRFFLTTNSRAPEVNIFSRPRVTLWPISAAYKYRTSFDDLFLFTSKIYKDPTTTTEGPNDKKFCFYRWDAKSSTHDFLGDWTNTATHDSQNVTMYDYLQSMTSRNVPGFGGNFLAKWPPDPTKGGPPERDQILTMIFDYVRAINLVDTGTTTRTGNVFVPYTPLFYGGKKDVTYDPRNWRSSDWSGQVTPIQIGAPGLAGTHGLGRFPMPYEVALIFYGTTNGGAKSMRCVLAIEMVTAMPGFSGLRDTYFTVVRPMLGQQTPPRPTKVKVGAAGTANPIHLCEYLTPSGQGSYNGLINIPNVSNHEVNFGRAFMPNLGFASQMHYFHEWANGPSLLQVPPESADPNRPAVLSPSDWLCSTKTFTNTSGDSQLYKRNKTVLIYPYVSDPISLPAGTTKFTLEAGNFDIDIWSGEGADDPRATLVQTVHIDFPSDGVDLPVPTSTADFPGRFDQQLDGNWNVIQGGDVIRSMALTCGFDPGVAASASKCGDLRLAAGLADVPPNYYAPRDGLTAYKSSVGQVHGLTVGHGDAYTGYNGQGHYAAGAPNTRKPPLLPKLANGVQRIDGGPGDFDKGISKHVDGAFGNKVDEGNLRFDYGTGSPASIPYYLGRSIEETGQSFFTPNRQISSPVMLGSIPTGVRRRPWETLLFRPNREVGKDHPGDDTRLGPPDHLILDLFDIPVIEPYAISEPFSTAGKVNLNYVIAPFGYAKGDNGNNTDTANPRSYIRRDTALRGVLKSEFIMAVPTGQSECGHEENPLTGTGTSTPFRFPINMNRTIEAIESRLKARDGQYPLFRSASEICTVDLYPYLSPTNMKTTAINWPTFWNTTYALTGDNMRERPYSHIYPRLTTKSNVYTVHMRTQAIKKSTRSQPNEFDPTKDSVVGEYRGSATIERFIDPNDYTLKDYQAKTMKLDPYYRYRIVSTKLFAPK